MIYPRTLVCLILYARLWCSASKDLYSFYDIADNFWDFDRADTIVDNKTSRQSRIQGVVSTTRSPAGTGLLVREGIEVSLNEYNESGVEDGAIPTGCLDPATCVDGFSVSVLIKVIGLSEALKDNIFLFGNRMSELHKGWSVGVLDKKLQIFVVTDECVCSFTKIGVMVNIWFHLGFSWKNCTLEVYIDDERFHDESYVQCEQIPLNRLLQQNITIGSLESTAAEYDNLAIWYRKRSHEDNKASWDYIKEFSRIPLEANLDAILLDVRWNPTLKDPNSAKSINLVEEFQNQMNTVNNSVNGNILQASVSTFRENEAKVTARMYFRFRLSTWQTLMQLQDIFESGALFNSRIEILNCSATDDSFCRVPDIVDVKRGTKTIKFFLHHFQIGHSGIIYGYMILARELGSDNWRERNIRKSIQDVTKMEIQNLKPFTNYSIRIFHYSLLGFRLGTELKIYQTAEAAPEDAPSINLDVINSTSLFVSWLHDIQPDKLNGILIGYRVRWKGLTSSQVLLGPEASSYTITGLVNDKMYNVYVAGRTNGGVGVEKRKNAKTHKNDPSEPPTVDVTPRFPSIVDLAPSFPPFVVVTPRFPRTIDVTPSFPPFVVVTPSFPPIVDVTPSFSPIADVTASLLPTVDVRPSVSRTVDVPPRVPPTVDECETNPCGLGEKCIDGEGSFFCLRITNDEHGSSCVFESRPTILNIDKNVNTTTELRKGEQYLFTTEVNSSCNQLSFKWKIANVRLVPFAVDTAHFTTVGFDSEWSGISSLDPGIHLVAFIVYFKDFYFLDYGFLKLLPSPPVAFIAGGSEVTRKHDSVITFDASSSYDLDLGPGEYKGMEFSWSCSNTSEGSCVGFQKQTLTNGGRMFSVDTSTTQINQYYDIKLTVLENGMSSSFEQRVHIVKGNPLYVEINCIINCGLKVNPSVRVTAVMNCTNSLCLSKNVQLRYRWTLFIQSPSNELWTRVDHESMAETPLNSSSLVIQPNALITGRNYYLNASMDNSMDGSSSGFSLWRFTTMSVPSGGVCTVNPRSGVAVEQTFTFACANWASGQQPLLYEFMMYTVQGLTTILSYGYLSTAELILPPGDPSKDYHLKIVVYIISPTGSRAKTTIDVQVLPWPAMSQEEASDDIGSVVTDSLVPFIIGGDLKRGTQLATALLESLKLHNGDVISIENRTQIENITITVLGKRKVRELRKLVQASFVLALRMDNPLEITPKVQELLVKKLQDITSLLASIADRGNVPDVPYIKIAESNIVFAWGKQLQLSAAKGEQLSISSSGSEIYNLRNQTLNSLEHLHMVLRIIAKSKVIHEKPTVIRSESMDALVVRLHPDKVSGYRLILDSGSVQLPDNLNEILVGVGDLVDVEVIASPVNYFAWDPSANVIASGVLEIELRGESGQVKSVHNLADYIQLEIQLNEQSVQNESIVNAQLFLKPGKMQFHTINVIQEGTSYLLTLTTRATVKVFVKHGSKPSVEDHEGNYTIPDFSSCIREIGEDEYNCSRNPHQLLLRNDVLKKPGAYYLGLLFSGNYSSGNHSHRARRSCFSTKRQKRSCVETKDPPPPLGEYVTAPFLTYDALTDVNYTMDTEELSCRFWSEDQQKWVTDGCKVGPGSTRDHLLCWCNHLTSFGGGLLVAPNPINMDVVFKELSRLHETGNFSVLLTIVFMFTLYVLAILLAKRADRRDNNKLGPKIVLKTEENDNEPFPNQYEIVVSTGVWLDSGTTANVTMMFYGSSCNSGKITVSPDMNPSQVILSRGSVDKFIVSLSPSLGTLHHAYVWHDNYGDSPSWFLDYIIVKDKETETEWKMACNQWFSPHKDDGSIFRKLLVERTNSQLPGFQQAFRSKLSESLYETHLWMSSVTKRPGNSFTRAQRVTCCLCLVFTAMLANATFYNLGGEVESSTIRIGPLKVSTRQIVITIQSCLIIAPINLFIVAVFKNSSPTFGKHCCKRSKDEKCQDLADEDDKKPLHHIFVYIAWFLCLAVSIASATVVFFYSLMWGKETADEWLSSILMSITMDILAIQPVRLIILAAIAAVIITKAKARQAKISKKQRSTELDKDDEGIIASEDLPDPMQLEWFKKYRMDQAETMALFRSLTFFLSFLVILAIVCYGNRDYHQYLMGQEARAILPKAEKVHDALGFWTWMNNTFAKSVDASRWYNGDEETNKVYISDKSSILLGMPRIRQLRIRKETCPEVIVERYINVPEFCFPHYSKSSEDKTALYLPRWRVLPNDSSPSSFKELCPKPWRYRSSEEMNNSPKRGSRASYGGGGYVADLGYDLKTTRAVVKDLSQNYWIDEQTRAAIVEFTFFNSNMNILIVCNYFFEFLPTGGVVSFIKVDILDLYGTETGFAQTVLFFRLLLIIMIVAYLVIEVVKLYRHRWSYFKSIWNWLSIVLIVTSVTAVLIHIIRGQSTKNTIKELNKNFYATVSFDEAVRLLEIETIFLSVVVFLATIRLLSLLRFSKQIIILSIAVRFAGKCLASFSIIFIIIFLAFAISGILAFGAVTESYSSFLHACVAQFEFLLGKAVPQLDMRQVDPFLAFLFCSLFICCMTVIFINVFIAILDSTMALVNRNLDGVSNELDLADFIVAYFTHGFVNIFRRKPHKKSKLYCENMTVNDECAYVENCLGEIDRRITVLAEDTLTENYARLMKAWLEMPSRKQPKDPKMRNVLQKANIYSMNDDDASLVESCTKDILDEDASLEESLSNYTALEDISLSPAMPEKATAEGNGNPPTTSSKVDVAREKVIRMVKAIESSPDNNHALVW